MIKDCKILLTFLKLRNFSVNDYYFNPCLFSILFKESVGINNFMLIEMDRYENSEDDTYVYSLVSGFTPINDQEEFLDRHFDTLRELMSSVKIFNCQVKMSKISESEDINVNEMIKLVHHKLVENEYK